MEDDGVTCARCRWWDNKYDIEEEENGTGVCRRHAPVATGRTTNEDDYERFPLWPLTLESEWCGDWEHKPHRLKPS